MSASRNLPRENEMRRRATRKKNADGVIIGYIKTKHPSIYDEAEKYLQGLRVEYPDKMDLSKTKRYRDMLKTGPANENCQAKSKVMRMDSFRLQIQLDDYAKTANPPARDTSAEVQTTRVEMASTLTELTTAVTPQDHPQDATLSLMDEGTLEELMNDLREDPTIADFFNNVEYQIDNCPLW